MCSSHSFRPAPKEDLPHTAEELRVMKEELDRIRDEFLTEENELLKKIHRAQEAIRKDIEQKKARVKLEDEKWVFEKSANGWI